MLTERSAMEQMRKAKSSKYYPTTGVRAEEKADPSTRGKTAVREIHVCHLRTFDIKYKIWKKLKKVFKSQQDQVGEKSESRI